MGAIKPFDYTHFELAVASGARALNHPCRVKIMHLVHETPGINSIELSRFFKMSKSTMHDHLLKLKDAGLINMEYHVHSYRLFVDPDGFHRFLSFETFFGQSPTECMFKKEIH